VLSYGHIYETSKYRDAGGRRRIAEFADSLHEPRWIINHFNVSRGEIESAFFGFRGFEVPLFDRLRARLKNIFYENESRPLMICRKSGESGIPTTASHRRVPRSNLSVANSLDRSLTSSPARRQGIPDGAVESQRQAFHRSLEISQTEIPTFSQLRRRLFLRNDRGLKTRKTETVYTKIFTPPAHLVS
jgi:hypothetical protein